MSIEPKMLIAFLNSRDERRFGDHAGKTERDHLATPEALKRWLVKRELISAKARVTRADVEAVISLRDLLRAHVAGDTTASPALSARARRHPLVVTFADEPALTAPGTGVDSFLAAVLEACAKAAADGSWQRVKMCAAEDCHFVFYDRGRNRLGRWCAMEACGGRMKARRYRERKRQTSGAARMVRR